MHVSLDGGVTFQSAPHGVRMSYEGLPANDTNDAVVLSINATSEGVIMDVYDQAGQCLGTRADMAVDIVAELVLQTPAGAGR